MNIPSVYSTAQAAKLLGVSRNTLLRWFREGRIHAVDRDHNGWRRFTDPELQRIRRELLQEPLSKPVQTESAKRMRSYLRRVPTFAGLPDEVLDRLAESARFQGYLQRQLLFSPGERTQGLYILVKGRVRIYRASLEGREQTLAVVVPYQTLGESALFRQHNLHGSYAVCQESSTVIILPVPHLSRLCQQFPALAASFLREFSRRIENLEQRLEDQALLSLEQRLARFLLERNETDLSVAEMASYLGVARESLSRALLRFSQDGLIKRSGRRIAVSDSEGLARL